MTAVMPDPAAATPQASAAAEPAAATPVAAAPAPVIPESYDLALPDGSILAPDVLARVTETAKALKVATKEDAARILDVAHQSAVEVIQTYEAARAPGGAVHTELVKQYEAEALKHPQLGNGDPRQLENKALRAGLFLNEYAPELAPILKETGLAAKAEFLLFANAMLDRVSEKPLARPDGTPPAQKDLPYEERIYGKKK